jgi:hypothetical protein
MTAKSRRLSFTLLSLALGASLVAITAGPAAAAPSDGYGGWQVTSSQAGYSGTVSVPAGFPAVTFTSDSRVVGSTPVQSGETVWIPDGTAFGVAFGSSAGKPYINLRPKADNSASTSASTTTYSFATPTPVGTWGINFGDIDAEILTVSATDTAGAPVSASNLGVQPAYNYCDASPRSSSCSGQTSPYVVPTVTSSTTTVVVQDPQCPTTSARCDTAGSAVWLSPHVALASLTVTAAWKQGFPSYQTWFATTSRTIDGTVTADCLTGTEFDVQLLDGGGAVVAATTTNAGQYIFPSVAARDDYTVRVDPASLPNNAASTAVPVDVAATDSTGNVAVTSSFSAAGFVTGVTGPAAGIGVGVTRAGETLVIAETLTNTSGAYQVTGLTSGQYVATVTPPDESTVSPADRAFAVDCANVSLAAFAVIADPTDPSDPTDPTDPASPSDPTDPAGGPSADATPSADELPTTGMNVGLAAFSASLLIAAGASLRGVTFSYRRTPGRRR